MSKDNKDTVKMSNENKDNKDADAVVYYPSCFHCNPERKIPLHPTKALQNAQNPTLDFVHLQPSVTKNVTKSVNKSIKDNTLKSFNKKQSPLHTVKSEDGTTPTPTLYCKQRSFMYKFNVNILDKYCILKFNSIMKKFMIELSYEPNDINDVHLFYMQEDVEELYNVHKLRCIYKNKFTFYDDACNNIHLIEKSSSSPKNDDIHLIVKFQKMKI